MAACVVVADWSAATAIEERVATVPVVKPYRPGAFYERELPCIAAVLSLVRTPLDVVVVDGYVELDDQGTPGSARICMRISAARFRSSASRRLRSAGRRSRCT